MTLKEQPQSVEEEDEESLCHEYSAVQNYSVPPYPRPVIEAKNKRKMAKIHFEVSFIFKHTLKLTLN